MTPAERRSRPRRRLLIGVVLAFIVLNLGAYTWYTGGLENLEWSAAARKETRTGAPSLDGVALTQRGKALDALERGEYERAVALLEAAQALNPNLEDIDKLLSVARSLASASTTEGARATAKPGRDRPASASPRERPAPADRAAPSGVLLVTSVPDRLLIRVDGQPKDLTPARIALPPGPHVVELFRGGRRAVRRTVNIRDGGVSIVSEQLVEPPARPAPEPRRARPAPETAPIAAPREDRAAAARADLAPPPRAWAAPSAGPLSIVVHVPSSSPASVERALAGSLANAVVTVVPKASALVDNRVADAVIARPSVLRDVGLSPSLSAIGGGRYSLLSFSPLPSAADLSAATVAVVADLDRSAMKDQVARILGLRSAPRLRRVPKAEDLVSTLQLELAQVALVRQDDLALFKRRTERRLYERTYDAPAVAFTPGARRRQIEPLLRRLQPSAQRALGVKGWQR